MAKTLSCLLKDASIDGLTVDETIEDPRINGIELDSRLIKPGFLFAALPGSRVDGTTFINSAIEKGAKAVLLPPTSPFCPPPNAQIAVLRHPSASFALSQLVRAFYSHQPETLVAVTGTNGKTSVVNFLRQIWQSNGLSGASIGTLGILPRGIVNNIPELTSPDAISLHRALDALKTAGIQHTAIEASSHGLDQHRLHGLRFKAAGFTNFSQDHLDYHNNMDRYLAAKARLFSDLCEGPAVINADHTPRELIEQLPQEKILRVSSTPEQHDPGTIDISVSANPTNRGLAIQLTLPDAGFSGTLQMVGTYQAENVAMAAGLALASGLQSDHIVEAVADLLPAPGRMDWAASHPGGGPVLIDYAHTPDALISAIKATRPHVKNRLIVVFGAGGDRDPSKRKQMGKVAHQDADIAIVTDDNPRNENPALIRRAILEACPSALEVADRKQAIATALDMMQPGDGVLIAGRGHETGQIIGDQVFPFDDFTSAQALAASIFR